MLLTKRERMPAGRSAGLSGTSAALVAMTVAEQLLIASS